jgi:hypothetical protein
MAAGGHPDTMSETHAAGDHGAGVPPAQVPDTHGTSHAVEGPHGSTADHGDGHGHDDHGHVSEPLGPTDWAMWGVGVLGAAVALVVVWAIVLGTGFSFTA